MSLLQSKEKDGSISMRVCGYLPREPKSFEKFVVFTVSYGKKKYMDVKVWKSNADVANYAECLEAHDTVAVDGVYETYVGKDDKEHGQVIADFITAMGAPAVVSEPQESGSANPNSDIPDGFTEEEEDPDGQLPF